jgi:hypothetical protein
LEEIQSKKSDLKNWKLSYIVPFLGILVHLANPATNTKIIEEYSFDITGKHIGTKKIEEIEPSGWSWL